MDEFDDGLESLPRLKVCPKCEGLYVEGEPFCRCCGAPIGDEDFDNGKSNALPPPRFPWPMSRRIGFHDEENENIIEDTLGEYVEKRIDPFETDLDISEARFECVMLELMYLKMHERNPEDNNSDLYPRGWFEYPDYDKQFEILVEAIAENKKIVETRGYLESINGRL